MMNMSMKPNWGEQWTPGLSNIRGREESAFSLVIKSSWALEVWAVPVPAWWINLA